MRPSKSSAGCYWRFAFSTLWYSRHPWSLDGRPTPYVGYTSKGYSADDRTGGTGLYTFGPLALICITIH